MEPTHAQNIEDGSVRISLKMLWTMAASMVVGSLSIAGLWFGLQGSINEVSKAVEINRLNQVPIDALQNLQLENIKLNATSTQIDLKDLKRQLDLKQDKNK
ncbi:hypothetical protein ACVWYN_002685 [Pedobacter sp. UYP24]